MTDLVNSVLKLLKRLLANSSKTEAPSCELFPHTKSCFRQKSSSVEDGIWVLLPPRQQNLLISDLTLFVSSVTNKQTSIKHE